MTATLTLKANRNNLTDAQRGSDVLFPIFSSTMKNIIKALTKQPTDRLAQKVLQTARNAEKALKGEENLTRDI